MPKETKTKPTRASVKGFLAAISDEQLRADCLALAAIMQGVSKQEPYMWGPTIVGFGSYHYVYASGHEGDAPLLGFSPRAPKIVLYVMLEAAVRAELLAKLGKHSSGKGCVYLRRLSDAHLPTLKKMLVTSMKQTRQRYPAKPAQPQKPARARSTAARA